MSNTDPDDTGIQQGGAVRADPRPRPTFLDTLRDTSKVSVGFTCNPDTDQLLSMQLIREAMARGYVHMVQVRAPVSHVGVYDETIISKCVATAQDGYNKSAVIEGYGFLAIIEQATNTDFGSNGVHINVFACTRAEAKMRAKEIVDWFPAKKGSEGSTEIGISSLDDDGGVLTTRFVNAQPWEEIRENYVESIHPELDRLITHKNNHSGKLIVLRGDPGTGKTYFLMTLAREWADRANVIYVTDPEKFLNVPGYLHDVITRRGYRWTQRQGLKVFILEDVDEYIAIDSKMMVGQAIGRLLNLVDGLFGIGLKILLILTTNVELGKLNPALTRKGRCMANIDFKALPKEDAQEWLKRRSIETPVQGRTTLADLYAMLPETLRSGPDPAQEAKDD